MTNDQNPFITLAVITGAHGVKGAVKVRSFTDVASDCLSYALTDALGQPFTLKQIGEAKGQLICCVKGVRYRDEAEKLKGVQLGVARSTLPEPNADEFYIEDLIGMVVVLEDGTPHGTVKTVYNFGAGDILEIATTGGDEMVSFDEQTIPSIDHDARRLTLCPPDILKGDK